MGRRTLIVGDGSIGLGFRSVSGDLRIHGPAAASSVVAERARSGDVTDPTDPADPADAERMAILRALERGELDVPAAMDRLALLDATPETGDGSEGTGREGVDV
jgi:hypothetical protein